jgi:hypothetical protein
MNNTEPTNNQWVNVDAGKGEAIPVSYKTPIILLISSKDVLRSHTSRHISNLEELRDLILIRLKNQWVNVDAGKGEAIPVSYKTPIILLISSKCSSFFLLPAHVLCLVGVFLSYILFLTGPLWQFWGVGQGKRKTKLYLWYPYYQAQWDNCDQQSHQTYKYLVKEHQLCSGTWT